MGESETWAVAGIVVVVYVGVVFRMYGVAGVDSGLALWSIWFPRNRDRELAIGRL